MGTHELSRTCLIVVLLFIAAVPARVRAIHKGGVASCAECHIMHETDDGQLVVRDPSLGWNLRGETPSDICLVCHAENFGAVFGSDPLAPSTEFGAGNFVFLLEDNINDEPDGGLSPILGEVAGHNIVAPGHGLEADTRYTLSPGGSYEVAKMGCTSCHDAHGNDNFRMLNGVGPVAGGVATFTQPAPVAEGAALSSGGESRVNHSAFKQGVSLWCGNCHGRYHDEQGSRFEHPVDEFLEDDDIRDRYNRYEGSDNPMAGVPSTSYLPEVPFEDPSNTSSSTSGPTLMSRIMCLTCHRAHASSAPSAGRWDFRVSLLSQDGEASGSYPIPDPYESPNQGALCQKCHEESSLGSGEATIDPFLD